MKKQFSVLLALAMVLSMVMAMSGCGGATEAEADDIFAGEMIDAQNDRIVVRGNDETMLFVTSDKTKYDLQEETELGIGDKIEVDYHKGKDSFIADTVRMTEHVIQSSVFAGEVTELEKSYLTVQSDRLTVVFTRNDETKVEGNLSQGDQVTVTYKEDLSANPRAISIVVIQEKKKITEKKLHGTVSETGEKSAVISVDSAHACRIQITPDTTFSGDDTKLRIGDEVDVVYTGSAEDNPVAKSIKIKRNQKQTYFVMDGVIDQVSSNGIVIRTSQNSYNFGIVSETRIQNRDYMKAGHKTTVTYTGELTKNPVAASIYCSKDTVTEKEKQKSSSAESTAGTEKTDGTAKTKEAADNNKQTSGTKDTAKNDKTSNTKENTKNDSSSQSKETTNNNENAAGKETAESTEKTDSEKSDKESAEIDESAESDKGEGTGKVEKAGEEKAAPATDSVIIQARGEVNVWANPCVIKVEGSGTLKLDISDASVSGGYIPQEGDQVLITYDKDSMKLTDIQLQYRFAEENTVTEQSIQSSQYEQSVQSSVKNEKTEQSAQSGQAGQSRQSASSGNSGTSGIEDDSEA